MFCCHGYAHPERSVEWRPEVTADPALRVSQRERDEVIAQLQRHTGDGRLTLAEFEERVEEALVSRTRGELDHVLRELPRPPRHPSGHGRRPRPFGLHPVALIVLVVAVAAVTSAWWLLWLLFWLVPAAMAGGHRYAH